jgi:type VI secretion system protein ImpM
MSEPGGSPPTASGQPDAAPDGWTAADPEATVIRAPGGVVDRAASSGPAASVVPAAPGPRPGAARPGWYGKLPGIGDFAARRVPDRFRAAWDQWLEPGLDLASRLAGDRWHDFYLTFPVWRFAIPPELIDSDGWIGVLMPSVDRVGRCFPLTLCEAVAGSAFAAASWLDIDRTLDGFQAAGLTALEAGTVESTETALEAISAYADDARIAQDHGPVESLRGLLAIMAPAAVTSRVPSADGAAWPLSVPLAAALADAAGHRVLSLLGRRVLWWASPSAESGGGAARLVTFPFPDDLLASLIGLPMEPAG